MSDHIPSNAPGVALVIMLWHGCTIYAGRSPGVSYWERKKYVTSDAAPAHESRRRRFHALPPSALA